MKAEAYDAEATIPRVGSRWVWEIDLPSARSLVEVIEVLWNGEEWFVRVKALLPDEPYRDARWVDVGRFWEAVTLVGGKLTGRTDLWQRGNPTDAA